MVDPVVVMASPPCKAYSTADVHDLSQAPELIALTRDHLSRTGRLFVIENVKGGAAGATAAAESSLQSGTYDGGMVWPEK